MKLRIATSIFIILFFLVALSLKISSAAETGDPCRGKAMMLKNLAQVHLWYSINDVGCEFWNNNHIIKINPGERLEIFSDKFCEKKYCADYFGHGDLRSLDRNRNCRVKILPDCNLLDM